ncbi:MAG: hypothetical protein M3Y53_10070 [Thermoproteota archaeon]|nr:hypothetical protein [Thermoproteota archaeon]
MAKQELPQSFKEGIDEILLVAKHNAVAIMCAVLTAYSQITNDEVQGLSVVT